MGAIAVADHPIFSLEEGSGGPVTTISAIPLPAGAVSTGLQGQAIWNDEISDTALAHFSEEGRDIHSTKSLYTLALNGAFGVTDNLTIGLSLPYVWRNNLREAGHHEEEKDDHHKGLDPHEEEEGTVESLGDSEGLGDMIIYGQYRFFHDSANDRHAAIIAGVKTPTGRTDVKSTGGEMFEAEHQPGSGSWDPLVGVAVTQHWGRWSLDANVLYTFATEGSQDTNLGDILNYNVSLSYQVLGASNREKDHDHASDLLNHSHGPSLDFIVELNGDWREKVEIGGESDGNTGGNIVYLSAGGRVGWGDGWSASLSAGIPIIENLNGIQSEPQVRGLAAVSKAF